MQRSEIFSCPLFPGYNRTYDANSEANQFCWTILDLYGLHNNGFSIFRICKYVYTFKLLLNYMQKSKFYKLRSIRFDILIKY